VDALRPRTSPLESPRKVVRNVPGKMSIIAYNSACRRNFSRFEVNLDSLSRPDVPFITHNETRLTLGIALRESPKALIEPLESAIIARKHECLSALV